MLSTAFFVAKFRFDTAENEPAKNLQKKMQNLPRWLAIANENKQAREAKEAEAEVERARGAAAEAAEAAKEED